MVRHWTLYTGFILVLLTGTGVHYSTQCEIKSMDQGRVSHCLPHGRVRVPSGSRLVA